MVDYLWPLARERTLLVLKVKIITIISTNSWPSVGLGKTQIIVPAGDDHAWYTGCWSERKNLTCPIYY